MARKTRTRKMKLNRTRRNLKKKSMRKNLRRGGGMQDYQREYSEMVGGMRDEDPRCSPVGQPNNRNNLPYFPYIARGSLNSGFQYGDILMKEGGKKYRKSKRGGGCGGQANESWFRGAYPVLMT
jgi:hypothetical protein